MELYKINKEQQIENEARVNRIKEHKRNQIIETHIELQTKNEKKKRDQQYYDCLRRKQTVEKHMAKSKVYELLDKLMRTDPSKTRERKELISKLNEWNEKYKLGMNLNIPVRKKVEREENEDDY